VRIEYLDKPAHMGALKIVGQTDRHGNGRSRGLSIVLAVKDDDRIAQAADSYSVNGCVPVIVIVLDVVHQSAPS
jgi:hypothetical protein